MRMVAVVGASGFVGRHVVAELLRRGLGVRALYRRRPQAAPSAGLRVVVGDASDPAVLADVLEGADAVVNAIGILREGQGRTFQQAHVAIPRALVSACVSGEVRRLVHVSALGVRADAPAAYQRTKFEGETLIRRSGLDWTILRPSLIHGPESEFLAMVKKMCHGRMPPWLFLPYFTRERIDERVPLGAAFAVEPRVSPVSVEGVARAVADALRRPESIDEVIPLVGGETLTWTDLLCELRDHIPGANTRLRALGIPAKLASIKARAARLVGAGALLPFDEGMPLMASEDSVASPAKARALLGFEEQGFTSLMPAYAGRI